MIIRLPKIVQFLRHNCGIRQKEMKNVSKDIIDLRMKKVWNESGNGEDEVLVYK